MRAWSVGLYLSSCSTRASAFAVVGSTSGGPRLTSKILRTGQSFALPQALLPPRFVSNKAWPSPSRIHGNRSMINGKGVPSMSSLEMGQDAGEMFDVYLPPASLTVLTEPPKPAGFAKARSLVHTDGDWHRSVHVWLHNSKGELVLQKRSATKDTFPGKWDVSVGGHFTSGEDSLETALKEVREELGLECDEKDLRFVCTVATSATGSTALHGSFVCNEYKDLYLLRYEGPLEELNFAPSEVDEVMLVPMEKLRDTYRNEDPDFIPRPVHYTDALFAALRDVTGTS